MALPGSITQTSINETAVAGSIDEGALSIAVFNLSIVAVDFAGVKVPPGATYNPPWFGRTYPAMNYDPAAYGAGLMTIVVFRQSF